ncbi:MAG: transcription termination factor Rho [Mycobacteriales bacterium]
MVLPALQTLAGELGISGVGRLRKSQLIEAIQAKQGGTAPDAAADPGTTAAGPLTTEAPARTARTARNGASAGTATEPVAAAAGEGDAGSADASADRADVTDGDATAGTGEGGRPERVDRGRERFLEREARRQERQAAAGGDEASGSPASGAADAAAATDRGARPDRGDRPDRQQADRQQADRQQEDRQQEDRQQRDRPDGGQQGGGQNGGGQNGSARDDDEFGGRRGRFRERGRGRNRGNRQERFTGGNEPDPVVSDDDVLIPVGGILDILDNYGFVRTTGYLTGPNDVYVSLQQVRKYGLRRGDAVTGAVRQQREGERKDKYNALVRLDTVNGLDPAEAHKRPDFTKLTPLYPQDRLRLETESSILTTRVIDLVMPIGKGQRALIVSPPKAGKTMVMQAIANAITVNNPECHLMVVLVDERPEEVTDMQRSVKGEVIASTFDRPPQDHITVAELSIERAKRLVELGHDVVVLLDSITRLGRAYNLGAPASGRILTGGVDSAALYPPKRFLGAARNIEHGGSLTIFATALVETGSAMDTVIFEEFKGTGNAELKLDRRLADKRIFPAIDVDASGTRKEEILLAPEELRIVLQLRRVLHALDATASLELLLGKMKSTRTNVEFLMQIQKTTVDQDQ